MKSKELVRKMSLEEKAAILSGKTVWQTREIEDLKIPSVFLSDGPHGIRKQAGAGDHLGLNASLKATCFPTAAAIANSWDPDLGESLGEALGKEAAFQEVDILLGPGLNIKRNPLCGRNFEYFSEDPYLSGKMAAAYIRGIQRQGVSACLKHFAVNNQELRRMSMNAVLDERALREIYLTGFEIAVKEGKAKALMSSYNKVNGSYVNENPHLLKEILRQEWGFEGMVVTDWGGSNNHVKAVQAGSNLEMPAPGLSSARELLKAMDKGILKEEDLDYCVGDLLKVILDIKGSKKEKKVDFKKHHLLARRAAMESAVLLKNEEDILPLKEGSKVALIGDFAFSPRYQGAGSSMVNPLAVETIEKMIEAYPLQVIGKCRGYNRKGDLDRKEMEQALALAKKADFVLYCFGLDEISESEGLDRSHMRIPKNQIVLLKELHKNNKNIVGVLSAGSSVEMPWQNCCKGLFHTYLSGQAGAGAILDLLTGKENPSGKLSESYPLSYEDCSSAPYFPSLERTSEYRESIFVGYRYYDTGEVCVRFPFGYGLSYTKFEYSDLKVSKDGVSFNVKNTGAMDGAEIAQLYIGLSNSKIFRPRKELKGFQKIFLKRGECKELVIPFDDKSFRYWNVITKGWEIEEGEYQIMVGASVEDIRLKKNLLIQGTSEESPYCKEELSSYYSGMVQNVSDEEFEKILGRPIPNAKWGGDLHRNDAICQMYYAKSRIARWIYRYLKKRKKKGEERNSPDLNLLFIYNMPFRALAKMTNGVVSMEMVDGIVSLVNGNFIKGIKKIGGGYIRNLAENRAFEKKLKKIREKRKDIYNERKGKGGLE